MDLSAMYAMLNYSPLMSGYYNALNSLSGGRGVLNSGGGGGGNTWGEVSNVGYGGQIPGYTIAAQPDINKLLAYPATLGAAIAQAAGQSQAGNAQAIGNAMGNYYTAASNLQAAPYSAWGTTQAARMNNLGNMNVAQINAEKSRANLGDILKLVDAQLAARQSTQGQNRVGSIGTNYGAGVRLV